MATRIQHRRGLAAEWDALNPVLADGEIGFERDTGVIKLGDGVSAWADLSPILTGTFALVSDPRLTDTRDPNLHGDAAHSETYVKDDDPRLLPDAVTEHSEDLHTPQPLEITRSNKDAEGIFTTVEYFRLDGTLKQDSVLSGGTSPEYTTRTVRYFDTDGVTVLSTTVYTLTYDVDGDLVSEVAP